MENRVHKFQNATSDGINSQFFHEIYFREKELPLSGYSGKVGYREKKGAAPNFLNYVLRLMKRGYYPGSVRNISAIFFYQTEGSDRVVRMYPQSPIWEPRIAFDSSWKNTITRIDLMYQYIKQSWPLEKIQDHLMIKTKISEYFDPFDLKDRGLSPNEIRAFCDRLISNGYPSGEIEHYYRMYCEKYFNNKKN